MVGKLAKKLSKKEKRSNIKLRTMLEEDKKARASFYHQNLKTPQSGAGVGAKTKEHRLLLALNVPMH